MKCLLAISLFLCVHASGASVSLQWDPSGDYGVTNYVLHWRTANGFGGVANLGFVTNTVFSPAIPGTHYFVFLTSQMDGVESLPSNEIDFFSPGGLLPTFEIQTSSDGKTWTTAGAAVMDSTNAFAFYRLLARHAPVPPSSGSLAAASVKAPAPVKAPFANRAMRRQLARPPMPF